MLTVLALVVLRLCLGCHFLYEGVWKIEHRDQFTAEPFLRQAKGPVAGFFYAMIPDINGRQRLQIIVEEKGKKRINSDPIAARWNEYRQKLVDYLKPRDETDQAAVGAHQRFETDAEKTYNEFKKSLEAYFAANLDRIEAYFGFSGPIREKSRSRARRPFPKTAPLGSDDGFAPRSRRVDQGNRSPGRII